MGAPLDPAAQNALLDAWLSRDLTLLPTAYEVALFTAHPSFGGVELDATGGYVRAVVSADLIDFPSAVDGMKTSIPIQFADATAAWSDTASHGLLIDAADSTTRYLAGLLVEEIDVLGAGPGPVAVLSFYWNTEGA